MGSEKKGPRVLGSEGPREEGEEKSGRTGSCGGVINAEKRREDEVAEEEEELGRLL